MNTLLSLLLIALPLLDAGAAAFAAKRTLRRGGSRGLTLPQGPSGLNFIRGLSNSRSSTGGNQGLQSSQAGTPEAAVFTPIVSTLSAGSPTPVTPTKLSPGANGAGGAASLKSAETSQTSSTPTLTTSGPQPAAASGNCHGEDWVDLTCNTPSQPANIPTLTPAEQARCEAEAAAAPFYLGAQCNPVAWWLNNYFYQAGGEYDRALNACREPVHRSWRTRHTYDNCANNYGSNQRRYIEGPAGSVSTHKFETQGAEPLSNPHVNEFVWAVRPIMQPRNVDVWISAEPGGEPVEGKGCRQHDVFIFSGDIHYIIKDAAEPLPAALQTYVDVGGYCILEPLKVYYFNFKIEQCEAAVCGVVSELYLH